MMSFGIIVGIEPDLFHIRTTRVSPITVITVVEVVGVSPRGQTSAGAPVKIKQSAFSPVDYSHYSLLQLQGLAGKSCS